MTDQAIQRCTANTLVRIGENDPGKNRICELPLWHSGPHAADYCGLRMWWYSKADASGAEGSSPSGGLSPPDLAARAKQMERDFRYDAYHGNSPRPKALIDAADLIRDLRAEIVDMRETIAFVEQQAKDIQATRDELSALRARHEELRRDFMEYARHLGTLPSCRANPSAVELTGKCDCGLDAARAKWND